MACFLALWVCALGADFAILNLKIVEGDGLAYAPGSRATRGLTVEVTDEAGRAVPGAAVSFQLPAEGPSGEFMNGSRNDIATTQADGRATVWGMRWNRIPGTVTLRITAAKDGVRSGMAGTQYIDSAAPVSKGTSARAGHSKILLIALAVAGAAAAGFAASALHGTAAAQSSPVPTVSIGTPTVLIGGPQ